MATVPPGPSRNPFLSPQATGASSIHPPPSPSAGGPSLHSAFAGLSVTAPPPQQQPLSPQATAASHRSNNPFLDTRPNDPFEDRPASRQLSAQELAELEGTAVQVVERETAPQQPPPAAAPLRNEKARPLSPVAPAAPVASTSYGETSGRRVAEGNEDFRDDDEALEAAIQASLAEASGQVGTSSSAVPAASPPPLPARSTTTGYTAPAGPPPVPSSARPTSPSPSQAPADPPPAYTPSTQVQESTLDAGPRVPDFARRPELEPQRTGWSDGGGNPGGFLEPGDPGYRPLGPPPGRTSGSHQSPSSPHSPFPSQHLPPPQPPRPQQQQHQQHSSYSSGPSSSQHPPPQPPFDPTPSPVPIIGRPYLNNGQALVYPPTFHCWKCQNTGFKENDPTHPCRGCWKKYGRPYSTALALSWHPPPPGYQRPLGPPHRPTFPMQHSSWATPPGGMYRPVVHAPPVGSVVYQPGDPRIGGAPCFKCGGSGITIGFFEDDTCNRCGGVGRVF